MIHCTHEKSLHRRRQLESTLVAVLQQTTFSAYKLETDEENEERKQAQKFEIS